MSATADIADRTQRFNQAARAFTPPAPTRHAKLMPMKDGIIELRQKGASLRLIRELLATVDVAVGTDTIARFLADVNGEATAPRSRKRTDRRRVSVRETPHDQTPATPTTNGASAAAQPRVADAPAERPRSRGPRVADPRNL